MPWGMDILSAVGDGYLECRGGMDIWSAGGDGVPGGMEYRGDGYLDTRGVDILIHGGWIS